jgi:hypothetical protein
MTPAVQCSVCLDDFNGNDLVPLRHKNNTAAKTHKLCRECFRTVARLNGDCPLCRDTVVVTRGSVYKS